LQSNKEFFDKPLIIKSKPTGGQHTLQRTRKVGSLRYADYCSPL